MTDLSAEVTSGSPLHELVFGYLGRWWQFESGMHILATAAVRTEAGQVVGAQYTSHVSVSAVRAVSAEAAIVPRTVLDLALRVYVQERTLLVVAGVEAGIEVALGHLGHVELVQELALVPLLAETAQPMFANNCPVPANMSEWATAALVTLHAIDSVVELAHGRR